MIEIIAIIYSVIISICWSIYTINRKEYNGIGAMFMNAIFAIPIMIYSTFLLTKTKNTALKFGKEVSVLPQVDGNPDKYLETVLYCNSVSDVYNNYGFPNSLTIGKASMDNGKVDEKNMTYVLSEG